MFFDFHSHLHQYDESNVELKQIEANKIFTLACSVDPESYACTLRLSKTNPFIIPTFGIHPWNAGGYFSFDEAERLMNASRIIGEIGLDYRWCAVDKKKQMFVFEAMLDHCDRKKKHCVIHTKGAEKRVLDILAHFPHAKPIIHWYHGPEKYYKLILDRNYRCTFGCELFYSRYIRKLFSYTPAGLILSETDNPQANVWLGGKRKDPLLIKAVVKTMALVKKSDFETMNGLVVKNAFAVLKESGTVVSRTAF